MSFRKVAVVLSALAALFVCTVARADMTEIKIARQYGVSYLPLMLMQDQKLLEKHAAQLGIPDLKVSWVEFAGGNVMNDALLSDSLQIASGGVAPLVLLWVAFGVGFMGSRAVVLVHRARGTRWMVTGQAR